MPSVNIRENRRSMHPASKYDGVNSFEEDRIPVAYTADQLMRQLVKRQAENQAPQEEGPSYLEDMLQGAMPGLQSVNYDKYRPEQQYSYAERLQMLRNSTPENRAQILEMTAPKKKRMKKGFGAIAEALIPALMTGTTHANSKQSAYKEALAESKRASAAEESKQAKKMERDYLKGMLKKEAQAEKLAAQRELAEMKSGATRYAADRSYEGKKFGKHGAHGGENDEEDLGSMVNRGKELIENSGDEGSKTLMRRLAEKVNLGGIGEATKTMPLNKAQSEILAYGDILRGKLFNKWGYRNQAEFEHVPSVSPENTKEQNLAVINQLQALDKKHSGGNKTATPQRSKFDDRPSGFVVMKNTEGRIFKIPANEAKEATRDGMVRIK